MVKINTYLLTLALAYSTSAYTLMNCYGSLPSDFTFSDSNIGQSSQHCSEQCAGSNYFALFNHGDCYCGNTNPSSQSSASSCNAYCNGYPQEMCGGTNAYSIYTFGTDTSGSGSGSRVSSSAIKSNAASNKVSSSSKSPSNTGMAVSSTNTKGSNIATPSDSTISTSIIYSTTFHTEGGSTIFVTNTITQSAVASGDSSNDNTGANGNKKKKTNVGAIVGGVVGGVVGALVIAVIALFGIRHYNLKKEEDRMEKEYQEAIKPVEYTESNINDTLTMSSHGSLSFDNNTKDSTFYNNNNIPNDNNNNMNNNMNMNPSNNNTNTNLLPVKNPFDDSKRISTGSVLLNQDQQGPGNVLTVVNPDEMN